MTTLSDLHPELLQYISEFSDTPGFMLQTFFATSIALAEKIHSLCAPDILEYVFTASVIGSNIDSTPRLITLCTCTACNRCHIGRPWILINSICDDHRCKRGDKIRAYRTVTINTIPLPYGVDTEYSDSHKQWMSDEFIHGGSVGRVIL